MFSHVGPWFDLICHVLLCLGFSFWLGLFKACLLCLVMLGPDLTMFTLFWSVGSVPVPICQYRHVWSCLCHYRHVWSCLCQYRHVWSCLCQYRHVWSCLSIAACWSGLKISYFGRHVWSCLCQYRRVWSCLCTTDMFDPVCFSRHFWSCPHNTP